MNLKPYINKINAINDTIINRLDELSNKQLALIITSCIMGIFLLTLLNIQLSGQQEEEFLYELSFDEKLLEEEIPEEKMTLTELETHKAYNEAEKSDYADEIDNFKTLEELEQEAQEAASQDPDNSDTPSNNPSLNQNSASSKYAEKLKEQREKIEALKRQGEAPKINIKRRTTITYSLIARSEISLPNPVYTCESFGKVVINIKVDAQGNVTDANFNKSSSTTSNGCLVDNAINYALKSKFTSKSNTTDQPGTITYLFQGE
ncbi:hypothetical protein JM658_11645 [Joostella atrarenae]|uniref:Uncharacterized protein n=1 Tax=Joostella atrarenae TaxID=679257 RepID=A0ABS9J4X2_9FLAO|nr:hypothetical protein [Joostella atrarenae]MCF8715479.1 hypothetical protein [Joostella atrarenae]